MSVRAARPRSRRGLLTGLLLACLMLAPELASAQTPSGAPMALGKTRAPVTITEYASVGCPHCAFWANDVFPDLRAKYIDTGKIRFVLHEMLTGNPALAAAGFMMARCATPDRYFQVVDDIFAQQPEINRDGVEALARIAARAGLPRDRFDACLKDQAALAALNARVEADGKAHEITGTPTFFVGAADSTGERLEGFQTLDALEAAIARAQR